MIQLREGTARMSPCPQFLSRLWEASLCNTKLGSKTEVDKAFSIVICFLVVEVTANNLRLLLVTVIADAGIEISKDSNKGVGRLTIYRGLDVIIEKVFFSSSLISVGAYATTMVILGLPSR